MEESEPFPLQSGMVNCSKLFLYILTVIETIFQPHPLTEKLNFSRRQGVAEIFSGLLLVSEALKGGKN